MQSIEVACEGNEIKQTSPSALTDCEAESKRGRRAHSDSMRSITDHLTRKEKLAALEMALEGGMEPAEVFKAVTANVYGATERRKLIVEWGARMKLEASEAMRIAQ